jgi:hypothetical protein
MAGENIFGIGVMPAFAIDRHAELGLDAVQDPGDMPKTFAASPVRRASQLSTRLSEIRTRIWIWVQHTHRISRNGFSPAAL